MSPGYKQRALEAAHYRCRVCNTPAYNVYRDNRTKPHTYQVLCKQCREPFKIQNQLPHNGYSTEYTTYLQTQHWATTRKAALARAYNRCQICCAYDYLEVHHNTYVRLGKELDRDLIVLCNVCHARFHDRLAKRATKKHLNDNTDTTHEPQPLRIRNNSSL